MADDIRSEVRNADWQLDVQRTYVLAVEIYDQRLSDGEYRTMHAIRHRGGGRDHNFVTQRELAKDMKVHVKTIARRLQNLQALGYLVCSSRGYGLSPLKTITSMEERYDKDVLFASRKELLGSNRSEEDLRRLHNLHKLPKSSEGADLLPPIVDGVRSSDNATLETVDSVPQREQKRSPVGSKNAPPEGANLLPHKYIKKVNEDQVHEDLNFVQGEIGDADVHQDVDCVEATPVVEDQSTSPSGQGPRAKPDLGLPASARRVEQGTSRSAKASRSDAISLGPGALVGIQEHLAREGVDTSPDELYSSDPKTPAELEAEKRRQVAAAAASSAGARAKQKGQAASTRRKRRKAVREQSGDAQELAKAKAAAKKARQTAGSKLHDHCKASFEQWFPDVPWAKWLLQERSQAKNLLEVYGGDLELVTKCWDYCCENWDHLRKKLKLDTSYPTIGFLFGYRSRIVPMVQDVKSNISEIMDDSGKGKFEI